jgi:tetratricopeptide (TPR) repeat protein
MTSKTLNEMNVLDLYDSGHYCFKYLDYKGAINYYKKAIEKDNDDRTVMLKSCCSILLGSCYMAIGDFDNAIKYYTMVLEKEDDNIEEYKTDANYYLGLAQDCKTKEDTIDALKFYKIFIARGTNKAIYFLATYYHEIENYDEAIKYYKMTIEQKNTNTIKEYGITIRQPNTEAMFRLGHIYDKVVGDPYNASIYYKMSSKNGDIYATYTLALHYHYVIKDYRKAIKYYKIVIDKTDKDNLDEEYDNFTKDYSDAVTSNEIEHKYDYIIFNFVFVLILIVYYIIRVYL